MALLFAISLLLALPPATDETDLAVEAARQKYTAEVKKASAALQASFDEVIKTNAATGDLALVKRLQKELEEFNAKKSLPRSVQMSRYRALHENSMRAAELALLDALKKARAQFVKRLEISKAEALDEEIKALAEEKKSRDLDDEFAIAGSEWKGVKVESTSRGAIKRTEMRIVVTKRNGDEIEYQHWIESNARCLLLRGSIRDCKINARVVDIVKGKFSPDTLGAPSDSVLRGKRWVQEGVDDNGKPSIYLELFLVEKK